VASAFRYQAFLQDGENPPGDGHTIAAWKGTCMAVGLMRWLRCADTKPTADGIATTADGIATTIGNAVVARLLGEGFTLSRAHVATSAARMRTPTIDRRDNVLHARQRAHALNDGGAIG
jgi:hypothetical protein